MYNPDIRYRAHCIKCKGNLGDSYLRMPKREWICSKCNITKFNEIINKYKKI